MVAGAITGVVDICWSLSELNQFLATCSAKILLAVHVASLYAVFGGLILMLFIAFAFFLFFGTRCGVFLNALSELQKRQRDEARPYAFTALSLVLASVPLFACALLLAYSSSLEIIETRHHKGLVVFAVITAGLAAFAGSILAAFFLGRVIELCLSRSPRGRFRRWLSHPSPR